MSLYVLDENNKSIVITCFILLKYKDSNSIIKIFGLLNVLYKFTPKCLNTDFDYSQIKALYNCALFSSRPSIIPCLFHFSQAIIKKFKGLKIYNKFSNNRAYELLWNLDISCFIDVKKIEDYLLFF